MTTTQPTGNVDDTTARRRKTILFLKVVMIPVGLGVAVTLLLDHIPAGLAEVSGWRLAAGLPVAALSWLAIAFRFRMILVACGIVVSVMAAIRMHIQAVFYFFFLPVSLGTEVARFSKVRRVAPGTPTTQILAALVLDRAVGMVVLAGLAAATLPFVGFTYGLTLGLDFGVAAAVLMVSAAVALVAIWHSQLRRRLVEAWRAMNVNWSNLVAAIAISIGAQLLLFLALYVAVVVLTIPIGFVTLVAVFSAAALFQVVPIALLGVTAGDAVGVALLLLVGVNQTEAVLLVFVSYGYRLVQALVGGLWELADGGLSLLLAEDWTTQTAKSVATAFLKR